jgi:hypothetical protein
MTDVDQSVCRRDGGGSEAKQPANQKNEHLGPAQEHFSSQGRVFTWIDSSSQPLKSLRRERFFNC